MKNKLTPAVERRLRTLAERDYPQEVADGRLVVFRVCRVCGNAVFESSQALGMGFRVDLEDLSQSDCTPCTEVFRRTPELYRWVIGVIVHQQDQSTFVGDKPIQVPPA